MLTTEIINRNVISTDYVSKYKCMNNKEKTNLIEISRRVKCNTSNMQNVLYYIYSFLLSKIHTRIEILKYQLK